MSEIKEFKTESKKLLDLMINSIYTNKEIFLRELISNASDAIDKLHYISLKDGNVNTSQYEIRVEVNEKKRTITISDNGIGMDYDGIVNNLGTIAKSGSAEFLKNLDKDNEVEIIGQFGVGFYSAFMVAKKVVVETKAYNCENGYKFTSEGTDTYEIEQVDKEDVGTTITLYLRKNEKDEDYDKFLDNYYIQELVRKYSDYVKHPIKMKVKETVNKKDEFGNDIEGEFEDIIVDKTLNSMIPLWKKAKSEVSEEMTNEFYKSKFNDYLDPMISLHVSTEGVVSYNALLFIASKPPYDLYSEKYEKGLQLYTKGVFIMEKCKELLPDYLKFVRGLVDSSDLSLNISREMLQQNHQLEKIANSIGDNTHVIINADDPYLNRFKYLHHGMITTYGVDKTKYDTSNPINNSVDAAYCPLCFNKLKYDFYHTGHIGKYKCTNCDFGREKVNFEARDVDLKKQFITINNSIYHINKDVFFAVYYTLASYTLCKTIGISEQNLKKYLNDIPLVSKRMKNLIIDNRLVHMIESKNENNLSYYEALHYIKEQKHKKTIILGFDNVSRRYNLNDLSWLYDVEFELLNDEFIDKIFIIGRFKYDVLTRLNYANIDENKLVLIDKIDTLINRIKTESNGDIYTMVCFDMTEIIKKLILEDESGKN